MESTTEKTNKKAAKVPKPKAAKAPKPKKEKTPKRGDLVVFAFRLPIADRDLIHKAAGPGKATQFVLGAAIAAANKTLDSK